MMNECKHLRRGDCKCPRTLDDWRPTPARWTTTQGHYWEPGKPFPNKQVWELIQTYEKLLPPWQQTPKLVENRMGGGAHATVEEQQEGHTETEKEEEEPSWKKARWAPLSRPPGMLAFDRHAGVYPGVPSPSSTDKQELPNLFAFSSVEMAEPDTEHAYFLSVVKAILGYANLT